MNEADRVLVVMELMVELREQKIAIPTNNTILSKGNQIKEIGGDCGPRVD